MDIASILTDPATLGPSLLTAKVLGISSVLFLVLGVPLAYFLSRRKGILWDALSIASTLPLVFPPVAMGFVLLLLLGNKGPFAAIFSDYIVFAFPGLVIAAFVAGLPLMLRPIQAALNDPAVSQLAELSATLGKNEWQTAVRVILPVVKKSIGAGMLLALGRAMGEVGMTLMLGGNILGKTNTLSLEIYNAVFYGEFDRALVLSAIVGSVAVVIFIVLKRWSAL